MFVLTTCIMSGGTGGHSGESVWKGKKFLCHVLHYPLLILPRGLHRLNDKQSAPVVVVVCASCSRNAALKLTGPAICWALLEDLPQGL